MQVSSHIPNERASPFVRTYRADMPTRLVYNVRMARRGIPKEPVNWFLREWMAQKGMKQADMIRETDWSKATMSQLYNGKQGYSPAIIKEAARVLQIEEYELLMHPADANAIRRMRGAALRLVHGDKEPDALDESASTGTHD